MLYGILGQTIKQFYQGSLVHFGKLKTYIRVKKKKKYISEKQIFKVNVAFDIPNATAAIC